jgi:hypothetical protein
MSRPSLETQIETVRRVQESLRAKGVRYGAANDPARAAKMIEYCSLLRHVCESLERLQALEEALAAILAKKEP